MDCRDLVANCNELCPEMVPGGGICPPAPNPPTNPPNAHCQPGDGCLINIDKCKKICLTCDQEKPPPPPPIRRTILQHRV